MAKDATGKTDQGERQLAARNENIEPNPSRFAVPCSVIHLESAKRLLHFIIGATLSMALASIAAGLLLVYWE
jgi:hypothetical protein